MEYAEFEERRRALLRLARPQDLINAEGDLIDLHDAGFWWWRYAQLMQAFRGQQSPPPACGCCSPPRPATGDADGLAGDCGPATQAGTDAAATPGGLNHGPYESDRLPL